MDEALEYFSFRQVDLMRVPDGACAAVPDMVGDFDDATPILQFNDGSEMRRKHEKITLVIDLPCLVCEINAWEELNAKVVRKELSDLGKSDAFMLKFAVRI